MHFNSFALALNVALAHGASYGGYSSCKHYGLQYAAFDNPFPRLDATTYATFDPTYMKTSTAGGQVYYNSTTVTAGGFNSQGVDPTKGYQIYNNPYYIPVYNFAVNHRGYIYAVTAGTYTIKLSNVDDIALLWTGPTAQSGWTRQNAKASAIWTSTNGPGSATTTVSLTKGQYLPIRIIWANGGGPFGLDVTVTNPKGATILSSASKGTSNIMTDSCNKKAPVFAGTFGNEL